jgi:DNA invertase Pin-like site-specific DNA recombinase
MVESNCTYKAGLYCRLSSDDGLARDSSSILTQKMMLEKYCKENDLVVSDVYVDDGYSGLNFNRPSFNRLINDIESKILMIILIP